MNFYKHHIGDYDADTSHLSWGEDAAYRRLICLYYRREQPVPADVSQACRLVRAVSKPEREAVASVLAEFFQLGPDGWRNKRCDEEIAAASRKAEANRANGQRGGRPPKAGTEQEPDRNPQETHSVSLQEPTQNLSQTPDSRLQTPEREARAPAAAPDTPPSQAAALSMALRRGGFATASASDPRVIAAADSGLTPEEVEATARDCAAEGKGVAYALKAAAGRRADAAKVRALPPVKVNGADLTAMFRRGRS